MHKQTDNVDASDIARFEALAHRWWDSQGEFKPLHDINPIRLGFVERHTSLVGKSVLDVGCGGGILAEAMAGKGASVTGIDMAEAALNVARHHAEESKLMIEYARIPAETLAQQQPESYDIITCMEMLEHVPNPAAIIQACATLVKPEGYIFFSTLNRNPKSFLFAILGAEYLLHLLPRGTHEYGKFIRPSELSFWARQSGLEPADIQGMGYNPLTRTYKITPDVDVNYLMAARKP